MQGGENRRLSTRTHGHGRLGRSRRTACVAHSYFWVVNRLLGVEDVKEQVMTWSVPTTIGWAVSLVALLVASLIW